MLAAARKHKRVVQVGTQRRSTPHLIEARDRIIKRGQARQDRPGRDLLLLPHARDREPAGHRSRPTTSTTRCGPARRRCGRTTRWSTRAAGGRSWSTATASSATCASTCSTWCAGCSTWAGRARISSAGGILVDKASKANISDTQTATFDFGDLQVVWQHRTWGDAPDPKYPWGATFYGDKGTLKAERHELRLHPVGQGRPADARGRHLRAATSIPRTRPRRTWSATSRPPSAGT